MLMVSMENTHHQETVVRSRVCNLLDYLMESIFSGKGKCDINQKLKNITCSLFIDSSTPLDHVCIDTCIYKKVFDEDPMREYCFKGTSSATDVECSVSDFSS